LLQSLAQGRGHEAARDGIDEARDLGFELARLNDFDHAPEIVKACPH
jgi:hypothetical protein